MQNIHVSEPGVLEIQSAQRKLLSDAMRARRAMDISYSMMRLADASKISDAGRPLNLRKQRNRIML
jgi:hypothetical protein